MAECSFFVGWLISFALVMVWGVRNCFLDYNCGLLVAAFWVAVISWIFVGLISLRMGWWG